jgi:hypothetical protein
MSSPTRQQQSNQADHTIAKLHNDIENYKNTLYGVNNKLVVFNDLKNDVSEHQTLIRESEGKRNELHAIIKQTGVSMSEETEKNKAYQTELANAAKQAAQKTFNLEGDMAQLKAHHESEKQALNDSHGQRQQAYVVQINEINAVHSKQIGVFKGEFSAQATSFK